MRPEHLGVSQMSLEGPLRGRQEPLAGPGWSPQHLGRADIVLSKHTPPC